MTIQETIASLDALIDLIKNTPDFPNRRLKFRELEERCASAYPLLRQAILDGERYKAAGERLLRATERCEGSRGRFSCVDIHDSRCPKAHHEEKPDDWNEEWGEFECWCGADEYFSARDAIRTAIEDSSK